MNACDKAGDATAAQKWLEELARAAKKRVGELNAQPLANTAWAFATLGQLDEKLFATLAREAELRLSEFKAQKISKKSI